jgi:hypothetical protein
MRVGLRTLFAVFVLVWLGAGLGCRTHVKSAEVPKYADLVRIWKPIRVSYGFGGHIVIVQETAGGVESGKYIVPLLSSVAVSPVSEKELAFTPWEGGRILDLGSDGTDLAFVLKEKMVTFEGDSNAVRRIV